MRVSLDWLGEWIDLPDETALVERLALGGFEDVEVEHTGPDLSAVVVGRVLECGRHPNADRLSLCRVDAGGEPQDVVCGAPNVAAGQRIAYAAVGTRLPDGTKLKKAKIRGVVSHGMICSRRELGLGDDHTGILVLETEAAPGTPLPEVLAAGDRILELGITPNRGDATSLLGIAREVRAFFGGALRVPPCEPAEEGAPAADAVRVAIDASDGCHHYVARIVRGVRVGESPAWVRNRLEASGMRAINNVVDATNLALLELGQPLHAFDLARVDGASVHVRRAVAGEKLVTLDGEGRELDPSDLVIADASAPIALAGVMGGAGSEVGPGTTDVLIESAHFHPTSVRLTARRHGLTTEASYRFERGVDREGVRRAADRVALLIAELAGGRVAPGAVEAHGEAPPVVGEVRLEVERANRLLGTRIPAGEMAALLERLGIETCAEGPEVLVGRIPSHRNDLARREDLIEEVARVYGYERIPTTEPWGVLRPAHVPTAWQLTEGARDALAAAGLTECITLPFVRPGELDALRLATDDPRRETLRVVNPISEEEPELRSSLLPSLLRLVRQNRSRQLDRVRAFEVGRVFLPRGEGQPAREPLMVAAVLAPGEERGLWEPETPPPLFFQVKGIAKSLLNLIGYEATLQGGAAQPYLHPGAAATIEVQQRVVGAVGELHPEVTAAFEIDVPCAVLEVELGALAPLAPRTPQVREVSRQPRVRRDLAVLVPRERAAGELLGAIQQVAGRDLVSAEIFDRYEGEGLPAGQVSLAFRLVFQRADRTLQDAEVTKATERVVRALADRFGAVLR